jgi:L-threonylcarbamoyladenylate synthase
MPEHVLITAADASTSLQSAVAAIRRGELVVFPTETVYGIGARADMPDAVRRIYIAKARPPEKPLAFHIGDWDMFARIAGAQPERVIKLLRAYWPGPVTFLCDVAGQKTGFRFPSDPVAQALLKQSELPVVGTSANRSGEPSPTDVAMTASVAPCAAVLLDAGPTALRGDSTIIDVTCEPPVCVRRGVAPWP